MNPPPSPTGTVDSTVRLDKWLQVARAFKTRTQATRACTLGRVLVNGERAKPHRHLHLDDKVEIDLGDWQRILVVRELRDRPVAKAEAATLYQDLSGPRPKLDAIDRALRGPAVRREKGAGRPTKQERRAMEKFRKDEG
ncbi:MAG TPA: S4 domain-containing protein [Thermoanaerobaculia bacterium]|nr:S4 domain-containing protein [Thermoanaerobaculia bacterium]